jgi:hypothetical protein
MAEEENQEEVNESHPNEGEIEEAVENTSLSDSPEEAVGDDEPGEGDQS